MAERAFRSESGQRQHSSVQSTEKTRFEELTRESERPRQSSPVHRPNPGSKMGALSTPEPWARSISTSIPSQHRTGYHDDFQSREIVDHARELRSQAVIEGFQKLLVFRDEIRLFLLRSLPCLELRLDFLNELPVSPSPLFQLGCETSTSSGMKQRKVS